METYAGNLSPQDQVNAEMMLAKLHRDVQQKRESKPRTIREADV